MNPNDYISFYALRNWGKAPVKNEFVTELVYVHSKCMIVDDKITIVGSANINDRSMLGMRDSEIAVIVEDIEFDKENLGGIQQLTGRFSRSLRKNIFAEHAGLSASDLENDFKDPGNFL